VFICFLNHFEYPAINHWNPFGTWTPSELNPRCGYHHVLISPGYQIGFNIFTIVMPLRFREAFPPSSQRTHDFLQAENNFGIDYDGRRILSEESDHDNSSQSGEEGAADQN
jgi:hypothetical protein